MLDGVDNLIEISLGLKKSDPIFQTKKQRRGQKLNNRPSFYIMARRKPQKVHVLRILHAVDFHSLT